MGSVNGSCNSDSGECVCKLLVTGDKCDVCQHGASHLHAENHYGCSKGLVYMLTHTHFDLTIIKIQNNNVLIDNSKQYDFRSWTFC